MSVPETLSGIVAAWLEEHGYDGLMCTDDPCGCTLQDGLMPCDSSFLCACVPAYKWPCRPDDCPNEHCEGVDWRDEEVSWCMRRTKPCPVLGKEG